MRTVLRPRLGSLDVYSSALLFSLGATAQVACGGNVVIDDGDGEGGSSPDTVSVGPGGTTISSSVSVGPGGTGGFSTTGVTTGAGGGNGTNVCTNPVPVLVDGQDTGFDTCDGGQMRRRAQLTCPLSFPDDNTCCGTCPTGQICGGTGEVACSCVDYCTTDAECGDGFICVCGDPAGVCMPAGCTTGAGCGAGQECTNWDASQGCYYLQFDCTTNNDTCGGDLDCDPGYLCQVQAGGYRQCAPGGCAIGRPFLIDDTARTAPVVLRDDWCASTLGAIQVDGLDAALRGSLASAWEHTARMEHASVAAFARFSLQLLSLGAPADLVERTNRALQDETRHARAAFAIASRYHGKNIGPGPLAIDGALDGGDLATIVRLVVREGCVGETVAAVEAGETEARAGDPAIREVLSMIASDESEHAELAWRFLSWALASFGDAATDALASEITSIERELAGGAPGVLTADDEALLDHGIATERVRAGIRFETLRSAVLPCLRALALQPRVAASVSQEREAAC